MLVDGVEVGRQGGFDPYAEIDKDRLQPYDLAEHLGAGEHELRLELLDLGRTRPAALLDGLVVTAAGTVALRSDEHWTAWRDGVETGTRHPPRPARRPRLQPRVQAPASAARRRLARARARDRGRR